MSFHERKCPSWNSFYWSIAVPTAPLDAAALTDCAVASIAHIAVTVAVGVCLPGFAATGRPAVSNVFQTRAVVGAEQGVTPCAAGVATVFLTAATIACATTESIGAIVIMPAGITGA